jgi:hypothetical protein
MEAFMVDMKSLEVELQQARRARIAAEAASEDVEGWIWEVQHREGVRPRMAFFISGFDETQIVSG